MKTIKLVCAIIFSFFLFSCKDNKDKHREPVPVAYDYNDEKNQDVYSKYMRAAKVDWIIFDSDKIRKTLGKQTIPDDIYGKIYIEKIEIRYQGILDNFRSKEEVVQYYGAKFSDKPCEKNNVQGLVCFEDNMAYRYYYLPNIEYDLSGESKFPSFLFSCGRTYSNCVGSQIFSRIPYNISIDIHFNNPSHIFYILDYVDKHFYDTLGVHLWQPLPNKKQA
ncbi:hypothetical protein [Conchiformibius kuhniae]|uniref:Lipoprotein n=1 Tax=Conchiformibius kuhniae TaxID=211502 RepID=A0A8T9MVW6_9NEIS|nr:hypothetical protein [Conchiformibius kuhniae]UOP04043.1 hypothetical protein LVJ77_06000 [Conchiformibius kuhniae]